MRCSHRQRAPARMCGEPAVAGARLELGSGRRRPWAIRSSTVRPATWRSGWKLRVTRNDRSNGGPDAAPDRCASARAAQLLRSPPTPRLCQASVGGCQRADLRRGIAGRRRGRACRPGGGAPRRSRLTLDWTRAADAALTDYELRPAAAAVVAAADLDAVLAAEAVLVVVSEHDGRGMYVELGAALARAGAGARPCGGPRADRPPERVLPPPGDHPVGQRRGVGGRSDRLRVP